MTVIRIRQSGDVVSKVVGLHGGSEEALASGLEQSFVNNALEHIISFIEGKFITDGISGITLTAVFPEFIKGVNEEYESTMQIPVVSISLSLGPQREIGIGRLFTNTEDGPAYAFNQKARFEFDIASHSGDESDRIAGWLATALQRGKLDLFAIGFQTMKTLYSRPQHGWDSQMPWDFVERSYQHRLFRHLVYVDTQFDVVWIKKEASSGIITQICFGDSVDFVSDMVTGMSLEYLLIEEISYGWHGVLV